MATTLREFRGSRIGWLGAIVILWIVLVVAGILQAPSGADGADPMTRHVAGTTLDGRGSQQ